MEENVKLTVPLWYLTIHILWKTLHSLSFILLQNTSLMLLLTRKKKKNTKPQQKK